MPFKLKGILHSFELEIRTCGIIKTGRDVGTSAPLDTYFLGVSIVDNSISFSPSVQISLNRGYVTIVSEIDSDLSCLRWRANSPSIPKRYVLRALPTINGKKATEFLHRVIMGRILERDLLRDELVDHINGNGLDNRRENLRISNVSQNNRNRGAQSNSNSGYKGVHWNKKLEKWFAQITVDGRRVFLGSYKDVKEAAHAYNVAALMYHKEFARLNDLS